MKPEILEVMKCPHCGGKFELGKIFRKDNGEIITGIVKGLLLILHLHNSLIPNPVPGMPLSPPTWANLFKNTDITVVPERELIEDLYWFSSFL